MTQNGELSGEHVHLHTEELQHELAETQVEIQELHELFEFIYFFNNTYYPKIREAFPAIEEASNPSDSEYQDTVFELAEIITKFDSDNTLFQFFEKLRYSKEYGKFVRHDIGTSANQVFGASHELMEDFLTETPEGAPTFRIDDIPDLIVSIKQFCSSWPRYFVGMEHLVTIATPEGDFPPEYEKGMNWEVLVDAIDGWKQHGEALRKERNEEERVIDRRYNLTDFVSVDASIHDILQTLDSDYSGNVGLIGHAIRSCLHNAVKSKDGGANTTIMAELDAVTDDAIITIADAGGGLVQEQLDPGNPRYIFKEGTETSESGSTGLGLARLDVDLQRFGIDVTVLSQTDDALSMYPALIDTASITEPEIKKYVAQYRVGTEATPATTIFQFRIHKKEQ